jgi:hypothetical protein
MRSDQCLLVPLLLHFIFIDLLVCCCQLVHNPGHQNDPKTLFFHPNDMHGLIPQKLKDVAIQCCLLVKLT